MVEMCVDVVKLEVRMMVELVKIHARGVVVLEVGRPLVRRRWLEFDKPGQGTTRVVCVVRRVGTCVWSFLRSNDDGNQNGGGRAFRCTS
jgi:hypothetical protein